MKKIACVWMLLVLLTFEAGAEEKLDMSSLSGLVFEFSSGVGGWFTELVMEGDGNFTGTFSDSEMGEDGENYPNGTVYGCLFHGKFSSKEQVNEYTWRLSIDELELDEGQVPEVIEDGIRYVTEETPYGLEDTKEMLLYLKGSPISELPEGFLSWCHLEDLDGNLAELPFYGLYNEKTESGFVGDLPYMNMANPWTESTAEELGQRGFVFGIPQGAESVSYYFNEDEQMAEMDFTLNGAGMTARIQPAEEYTDISGMYYSWDTEKDTAISGKSGKIFTAKEDENTISVCLWYDPEAKMMRSLSACTQEPEKVDITAVAAQI